MLGLAKKQHGCLQKCARYSRIFASVYSHRERKKSGRAKNVYAGGVRPRGYAGFSRISPKADNKNRIINPFTRSSSHPRIILLLGKHYTGPAALLPPPAAAAAAAGSVGTVSNIA